MAIEVDRLLPGARVVRVLTRLAAERGLPTAIVFDNGPDFIGRAPDAWAYARGVAPRFTRTGKPTENAHVESLNGHFWDEYLNEHRFRSVAEAQTIIEAWRVDYNTVRPHHSLQRLTPAAYVAACAGLARGGRPARQRRAARSRAHPHRQD